MTLSLAQIKQQLQQIDNPTDRIEYINNIKNMNLPYKVNWENILKSYRFHKKRDELWIELLKKLKRRPKSTYNKLGKEQIMDDWSFLRYYDHIIHK